MTDPASRLSGSWNFRDVADSTSGAVVPGRLFRAGELTKLDDTGVAQLRDLRVTDVADLRSPREVERHGSDLVPDGVDVHLLPFLDVVAAVDGDAPHEHAFQRLLTEDPDQSMIEAGRRYMADEYRRFAQAPGARRAIQRMVVLLGDGGTVLTHCFAGKDRTGFGVAVILEAAGVDRDTIYADYLHSNSAVPQLRAQILDTIRQRFENGELPVEAEKFAEERLSEDVLGVRAEYLDAALATVADDYGSVAGYLRAAEVTDAQIDKLRTALRG